jgi:hypothetical protein
MWNPSVVVVVSGKNLTAIPGSGTQSAEIRRLGAAPDFVLGSLHALTEAGEMMWASATGSQLGPITGGAGKVILVVGAQKVVPDSIVGEARITKYSYPLEDARARQAYGAPSGLNYLLKIASPNPFIPGRFSVVIVKENIGF